MPEVFKREAISERVGLAIVLGLAVALFWQKFGWFILDPTEYGWLMKRGSDMNPDFLLWLYYLDTPWAFPIGMVEGYPYPVLLSVITSSSLTLFAIPAKVVAGVFGWEFFQYFGFWILLCCLLQGYFGWKVLSNIGVQNQLVRVIGGSFFLLSPCFLDRYPHMTLLGQWIILSALSLYFCRKTNPSRQPWIWMGLILMSVMVHPYFMVMVFGIAFAGVWKESQKRPALQALKWSSIWVGSVAALLWVTGFFHRDAASRAAGGFGEFSANGNTFFNAMGKTNLPLNLSLFHERQYEGFAYLGAGGILLVAGAILLLFLRSDLRNRAVRFARDNFVLLLVTSLLFVYALSDTISFGSWGFEIPFSPWLKKKLALFRSSGRFAWLPYYLILAFAFLLWDKVVRSANSWLAFLVVALALQVWDGLPLLKRVFFQDTYDKTAFNLEVMRLAIEKAELVVPYPLFQRDIHSSDDLMDIIFCAVQEGKPVASAYFPRYPEVDKPFARKLEKGLKESEFSEFPRSVWVAGSGYSSFLLQAKAKNKMQVFRHEEYWIGFPLENPPQQAFVNHPEVQLSDQAYGLFTDWIAQQDFAYLLISVRDEATQNLKEPAKQFFRDLGSNFIDSLGFRHSWVAAFGPDGLIREAHGGEYETSEINFDLNFGDGRKVPVRLFSAGSESGDHSKIELAGKNHSPNERGMNIVLLNEGLEVVHTQTVDTYTSSNIVFQEDPKPRR